MVVLKPNKGMKLCVGIGRFPKLTPSYVTLCRIVGIRIIVCIAYLHESDSLSSAITQKFSQAKAQRRGKPRKANKPQGPEKKVRYKVHCIYIHHWYMQ